MFLAKSSRKHYEKYKKVCSEQLFNKIIKLKKKDISQYVKLEKKICGIINDPFHNYKFLRHDLKKFNRVHLGHFVLIFFIDHKNKQIIFGDYAHHDEIYL
jgi:mRNA-degrading endonuclease RelE of RelBE toxin-antitoxin system